MKSFCGLLLFLSFLFVGARTLESSEYIEKFECPGTSHALVLGGGGVRGAYQIGALWYLINILGCDFGHYIGTSTGGVTAAILSQAIDKGDLKRRLDLLVSYYEGIKTRSDIVENRLLGDLRFILPS